MCGASLDVTTVVVICSPEWPGPRRSVRCFQAGLAGINCVVKALQRLAQFSVTLVESDSVCSETL